MGYELSITFKWGSIKGMFFFKGNPKVNRQFAFPIEYFWLFSIFF